MCDGQDQDCDGVNDEGLVPGWPDEDRDGFGDDTQPPVCPAPENFAIEPGDCNDQDSAINPGAFDVPDADYEDENCDGTDGTVTEMVFASNFSGGGSESEPLGTPEDPFRSLRAAIEAAEAQNIKYIAADVDLDITGEPNLTVSLIGGYNSADGWRRSRDEYSSLYKTERTETDYMGLRVENVQEPIQIANIRLLE